MIVIQFFVYWLALACALGCLIGAGMRWGLTGRCDISAEQDKAQADAIRHYKPMALPNFV
jgi:hypothetical protein